MCGRNQLSNSYMFLKCIYIVTMTIYVLQFHGSGGLSKCEGTSQEQALLNQAIRKSITDREEVKSLYEVIMLCIYSVKYSGVDSLPSQ